MKTHNIQNKLKEILKFFGYVQKSENVYSFHNASGELHSIHIRNDDVDSTTFSGKDRGCVITNISTVKTKWLINTLEPLMESAINEPFLYVRKRSGKPFKSGFKVNKIKFSDGIMNCGGTGRVAYGFHDDDSMVEVKRCVKASEYQYKAERM